MKDEGAIDWWEGFPTSIGQESKLKEGVLKGYQERKGVSCFFWGGNKGEMEVCERE
jgi:hypothetical protein